MERLNWKNYRASFVDKNGNRRTITFSTDAQKHDLVEDSAYSQIFKQLRIVHTDVYELQVEEI